MRTVSIGLLLGLFPGIGAFLVGCDDGGLIRIRAGGAFDPPEIEFGVVPLGMAQTTSVTFRNTSLAPLVLEELTVPPAFSVKGLSPGVEIGSGAGVPLEVSFIPSSEGLVDAPLVVRAEDAEIALALSGTGVLLRIPVLEVAPAALDFGAVELGASARLSFIVRNVGNATGTLRSTRLESGSPDFQLSLPAEIDLDPGARSVFTVTFTPTRDGLIQDTLHIEVAELPEGIAVPLRGIGGVGQSRVYCEPSAIVFGPVERGAVRTVTVGCTARGGPLRVYSVRLAPTEHFRLPYEPPALDLQANATLHVDVEFVPHGLPSSRETNLIVSYSAPDGRQKTVVPVQGEVAPPPPSGTAITVELEWDTDFNDLDLHFLRGDAVFLSGYDTYYAYKTRDWGVPDEPNDDPYLDRDDQDGRGPETLNMNSAVPGDYHVYVHFYRQGGPSETRATLNVWIAGRQVTAHAPQEIDFGDRWHAGFIRWNGEGGSFEPPPADGNGCRCVETRSGLLRALVPLLGLCLLRRRRAA